MLSTAVLLLVLAFLFTGIGLLLPRRLTGDGHGLDPYLRSFWLGWAVVIAFLQIWHFFHPVNGVTLILFAAAGLAGWALRRRPAGVALRSWIQPANLPLLALGLLPALVVANHVMFVPAHFDHGLYHMQAVKWISTYAIVPGLGNLHHRLAFNNSNFLYAAMLNQGPLADRSYYLSNTLLAFVLIVQTGAGVYRLVRSGGTFSKSTLYEALMFPAVLWQISTTHLPGYSPDIPVFCLQVVLGACLLRLIEDQTEPGFRNWGVLILALVVTGATVKLSFAVFGLLILLAGLGVGLRRFGWKRDSRIWKFALPSIGILAAWEVPWLVRSVILSGYPLFPSTLFGFPVSWKMPDYLADPVAYVISTWARTLSNAIDYTGDWTWFRAWSKFFTFEAKRAFLFGVVFAVIGLAGWVGLRISRRRAGKTAVGFDGASAALVGISLISLVVWFVQAPDYRFSGACFWIFLTGTLMFLFAELKAAGFVRLPLVLAIGLLLFQILWLSPNHFSNNLSLKLLINPVPETQLAEETRPASSAEVVTTQTGLQVNTPINPATDCWNLPLPCAPANDVVERLSAYDPNNLGKGFFVPK
jgi:hypothetical protein